MRVIVLGSGVIGVTTAYYLARRGVHVTVLDRQPAPALETSFANAGQISPGYAAPWAAPGIPFKALKWLMQPDAPLSLRPDGTLRQWLWLARMLRNCTAGRYAENKARMVRLAEYSRDCLRELRDELPLAYEGRQRGTLQVFRSRAQLAGARKDVAVLERCGVPFRLLDEAGCVAAEPALARVRQSIAGGLWLPNDETGDCQLFTADLARRAAALGVAFRHGVEVRGLSARGEAIDAVQLDGERLTADAYVVALGSYSTPLLAPLGLRIPVYPVKGYSLTMPITDADAAPVSTVMDETYKVALTRFEERIRVGGMAELAGFDLRLNPRRRRTLEKVTRELFPHGGDLAAASFWSGLRPMTPDGTPLVGATPLRNLWLNTGHGTLGWTMACGSGRLLTDLIAGRRPDIAFADLSMRRYAAAAQPVSPRPWVPARG